MSKINATIITRDCVKKGVFFQNPIQRKEIEVFPYDSDDMCARAWLNKATKWTSSYWLNRSRLAEFREFVETEDAAAIVVAVLTSPIYFKRNMRMLTCDVHDPDHPIARIESWGYESYFNNCSGNCKIEYAKIWYKDGRTRKIVTRGYYHMTYKHIVEEFLDTNSFSLNWLLSELL